MQLHFISTGTEFPYPYYLAVMSALRTQKNPEVTIWTTQDLKGQYITRVAELVKIKKLDDNPLASKAYEGKDEYLRWAGLKDFYVWKILSEHGGLVLDLDTFCLHDVSDLIGDKELMAPMDAPNVADIPHPFNPAIVMVRDPHNQIIMEVLNETLKLLASGSDIIWGTIGPHVMSNVFKKHLDKIATPPFRTLGGFNPDGSPLEVYGTAREDFPSQTRIIHLFAKASGPKYLEISEDYIASSKTVFAQLVKETLPDDWDTRLPLHLISTTREEKEQYDMATDVWQKAQESEAAWWRTKGLGTANSYHEELKQQKYAEKMGIVIDQWSRLDLKGKSVLDVGGGPASLLLKAYNAGKRKVIDPLDMPDWVGARYKDAGIELEKKAAEDMDEHGWDEVWMYNVLQHVQDPVKVIEKVKKAGKIVRVFDFLGIAAYEGHPNVLTADVLDAAFGNAGTVAEMADPVVGKVYYGVFDYSHPAIELHMVNTGMEFPYAYYLSVMSVLKTQKAAKINLWLVKEPVGKYYDAIKDKVTIRHINEEVPVFPALQGQKPGFEEAHLVDYFRWQLLHDNGGVFIDLDSLSLSDYCGFIKDKLSGDKEFLASLAVSERIPRPYHNSLFAGKKGSGLVKQMLDECIKRLSDGSNFKWGNSGPDVLNDLCAANQDKVVEAEYGLLGGCLELYQLYKADGKLPNNIRFVHLWANSSGDFWTGINEDYIENSDHLYAQMVRKLLGGNERNPFHVHKIQPLKEFIAARGKHYRAIYKYLGENDCKNIMEIGTYNGENAVQMIRACKHGVHYYGFDLFEKITPQLVNVELSHPSTPDMDGIKKYIESVVSAKVTLFAGNTNITLRSVTKDLPSMDLIFVDGGHSIETIRNDWKYASKLIKDNTVVFFDDYFPEMPFIGCQFLVGEIDKTKYEVEVLPDFDDYPKTYGRLRSQLMVVQLKTKTTKKMISDKPALHVLGLAHTKTTREYMSCAYTQKVFKMCKMMKALGYEVYHYGAEGSNPDCTEHIDVVSDAVQLETYGGYDWRKEAFRHDPKDLAYRTFDENAVIEINKRKGPRDLLLISMGNYQKPIFDKVGMMGVEMGIGYTGVFTDRRVFESYAWMHYIYGMMYPNNGGCDGSFYDCVIPNYYDPADFEFCDKKEDYYLYMGRLIGRKGVHIAAQCCQRIGAKLVIAGQGTEETVRACGVDPKSVEFVGYADAETRSKLMSKAKAIFVPTLYLEPFGGVNVEAAFCGTPAITTDFGGFTETVQHGKTGYRCHTMDDFCWAAKNVDKLDPAYIREYAMQNYSMDRVGLMYNEYFMKLADLWKGGWYELHPEKTQLDWLKRH